MPIPSVLWILPVLSFPEKVMSPFAARRLSTGACARRKGFQVVLLHGVELYLSIDPPEIALRQTVDVATNCMLLNSVRTAYYAEAVKTKIWTCSIHNNLPIRPKTIVGKANSDTTRGFVKKCDVLVSLLCSSGSASKILEKAVGGARLIGIGSE